VRSPIDLKLGRDLGLASKISMHVLVSNIDCFFLYRKQTKEQKNPPKPRKIPIDLKLGGDIQISTKNSIVCLFYIVFHLFKFFKHKQTKPTLWIPWSSQQ
jgi:hypothetical protein